MLGLGNFKIKLSRGVDHLSPGHRALLKSAKITVSVNDELSGCVVSAFLLMSIFPYISRHAWDGAMWFPNWQLLS